MPTNLPSLPAKPKLGFLQPTYRILEATRASISSFERIFESSRRARKARGTTTDAEQDLLRAMVLFAGAGLDSAVKQLLRDSLPAVVATDLGAQKQFEVSVRRRLARSADARGVAAQIGTAGGSGREGVDISLLAKALSANTPREGLLRDLIDELLGESMQSKDQLLNVAANFGIPQSEIVPDPKLLQRVFGMRNQIAHEMDIEFTARNRVRRSRKWKEMADASALLFKTAVCFFEAVEAKFRGRVVIPMDSKFFPPIRQY